MGLLTRPWAKSRRLGAWVGLMTDPKPNQKGRWDASGLEGTTPSFSINMGPLLSISLSNSRVKYSWKNVERERERVLAKRSAGKGPVVVV